MVGKASLSFGPAQMYFPVGFFWHKLGTRIPFLTYLVLQLSPVAQKLAFYHETSLALRGSRCWRSTGWTSIQLAKLNHHG